MWGFWAARDKYPTDPLKLQGEDLKRIVLGMTKGWHSNLRKLISETDPTTLFTVNIRTSAPIDPWPTTNITLIGDAIHTMTPGRGVGANTALRDAALLCRNLTAAKNGEKTVIQAIHEYEAEMIKYGFEAVLASRKQMDGRDPIHKPVIGRIMLGFMRTSMRIVNAVPPLKKRMAEAQSKFRGANRKDDDR
jgi:2-polyprenyl-6-methoxyphenol hydroxylase-like FAD-dependent oxidoreductase